MSENKDRTFGQKVIDFHLNLEELPELPAGIGWINCYEEEDTRKTHRAFYEKYFHDYQNRLFLFGINPGRFGAGLTGVGFTDPVYLEEYCKIPNPFPKKHELSSHFIYEVIDAYGGAEQFYRHHFITSVLPVGLMKDGKNYNYYDDAQTLEASRSFVIDTIEAQLDFGADQSRALCIGRGKNFKVLSDLNREFGWFGEIIPLPHPRWVLQYRRKEKEKHIGHYLEALKL